MNIEVYGAQWCSSCTQLKNKLKEKKITFIYKDVGDPTYANEAKLRGVRALPSTFIDNIKYIGLDVLNQLK